VSHSSRVSRWGIRTSIAVLFALFSLLVMTQGAAAKSTDAASPQQSDQPNVQQSCTAKFTASPSAGPPGTKLTISGTHWPAHEQVGIYLVDAARHLHPFNIGSPGVLRDGSWRLTIAVPTTVTYTPEGDEGTGAPVTQNVTAGSYLIYAASGDPNGFSINQICPAKFTVTNGPVASTDGSTLTSPSFLWVDIGLGVLMLVLLAIVIFMALRHWNRRKASTIIGVITLAALVVGILATASAFSAHSVGASPSAGTVLFSDDFESDTIGSLPTGWTVETGTTWAVQADGSNVLAQTSNNNTPLYGIAAGSPGWTDYSLSASVKPGPGSTTSGTSVVAIDGRVQDANNFYTLLVKNGNLWYLGKKVNGNFTTLATSNTSYNTTTWYTWTLTMTGNTISASINGKTLATVTDTTFSAGYISLKTRNQSEYDNIVVTSTGSGPTPTPTNTNTPGATPTATNTPAPTSTNTPGPTPTATNTPAPTATNTPVSATPTPTPTSGGTLFADDFESYALGSFPPTWTLVSGSWAVQQDGSQVLAQTDPSTSTGKRVMAGSTSWGDYVFQADVKPGANAPSQGFQLIARQIDANNYYSFGFFSGTWYLKKKIGGTQTTITQGNFSFTSQFYTLVFSLQGTTLSGSINGTTVFTKTDSSLSNGMIGLSTTDMAEIDNVLVTTSGSGGSPTPTPTSASTATPTATATPTVIGNISGQVTDGSSNQPIAGAQISTLPATITTTTDSNGNYTLANVAGGTYSVIATTSGYNATYVGNITVTNNNTTTANEVFTTPVPGFTSMDTYFRPDQTGWNPASDGNTWLDDSSRYPGASVTISGNQGFIDTFTAATDRDEWMGTSYTDELVSADFEVLQFGQDSFQHGARLLARVTDTHHFIDFAINYATSTLQLWVNNNEAWTMLNQINVPAFSTGQWYHAKLQVVGTGVYGKVWASGTPEPTNWQIVASQSQLLAGQGGSRSTFCNIYWDNFTVQGLTSIKGKVTNANGTAIANATVTDGVNTVTTDSSGNYLLIEPNTNATYTVTASASGFTSQSQNVTTTNQTNTVVNFALS
jgi:hypothetical protein